MRFAIISVCCAMLILFSISACQEKSAASENIIPTHDSLVNLGKYLVNTMGCDDCHTPKKMGPTGPVEDMDVRFAGFMASRGVGKPDSSVMNQGWVLLSMDQTAAAGPWGVSYAANISSDESGIGSWTETQFINCIRKGKLKGLESGRTLLPPMPFMHYAQLNDIDLKAIYAFLKTTKPVENVVPGPKSWQEVK